MRSVFARSVNGAGSLLNCAHRSVAAKPCASIQRATSHRGCDSVVDKIVEGLFTIARGSPFVPNAGFGGSGRSLRVRLIRRKTAFTNPAALLFPAFLVNSTASSTTADAGTRSRWSS